MNRDAAEQPVGDFESVILLVGYVLQYAHGFAGYFRPDAVAGENQNVELH